VEVKRYGLTLHYRAVAGDRVGSLLAQAEGVLRGYAEGLHVGQGPMAWEITPAVNWNKGSALGLILDDVGPPVLPVYAGDGANDAEALTEATARGGLAIGIGERAPPDARFRLDNPDALVEFLHRLAEPIFGHRAGTVA
jgi:trehalose-phosphatase